MLSLESDRWGELRDAYGSASNIPALLRAIPAATSSKGPNAEPFFSLWSALCHQTDVYSASFAAAPHLVAAAAARPPTERAECLLLAGAIEAFRHKPNSPPIPDDLTLEYDAAIRRAATLTLEALALDLSEDAIGALLGAFAAFRGYPQLAVAITDLESEMSCPVCDATFATPGFDYF